MRPPIATWTALLTGLTCIGLAWGALLAIQPLDIDTMVTDAEQTDVAPPPDAPDFAMPPAARFAEIVERPLFAAARRPSPDAAPGLAAPRSSPDAILRGVVATGAHRTALLVPNDGDDVMRLRVNDELNGWRLVEILTSHVVFRRGADEVRLELTYEQPPVSARDAARNRRRIPPADDGETPPERN